jgi:hypothetical protein
VRRSALEIRLVALIALFAHFYLEKPVDQNRQSEKTQRREGDLSSHSSLNSQIFAQTRLQPIALPPHQPGQQGEVKGHAEGRGFSLYFAHHLGIRLQLACVLFLLLGEKGVDSGGAMAGGLVIDDP